MYKLLCKGQVAQTRRLNHIASSSTQRTLLPLKRKACYDEDEEVKQVRRGMHDMSVWYVYTIIHAWYPVWYWRTVLLRKRKALDMTTRDCDQDCCWFLWLNANAFGIPWKELILPKKSQRKCNMFAEVVKRDNKGLRLRLLWVLMIESHCLFYSLERV
jgi:hypothetical protein